MRSPIPFWDALPRHTSSCVCLVPPLSSTVRCVALPSRHVTRCWMLHYTPFKFHLAFLSRFVGRTSAHAGDVSAVSTFDTRTDPKNRKDIDRQWELSFSGRITICRDMMSTTLVQIKNRGVKADFRGGTHSMLATSASECCSGGNG